MRAFRRKSSSSVDSWSSASSPAERLRVLHSGEGTHQVTDPALALQLVEDVLRADGASFSESSGTVFSEPAGSPWKLLASALDRECARHLCAAAVLPAPFATRLRGEHKWSLEEVLFFRAGTARALFEPFGGFTMNQDGTKLWEAYGGTGAGFLLYQALEPSRTLTLSEEITMLVSSLVGVPEELVKQLTWIAIAATSCAVEEISQYLHLAVGLAPEAQLFLTAAYTPQVGVQPPSLVDYLEVVYLLSRIQRVEVLGTPGVSSRSSLRDLVRLLRTLALED